MSGPFDAMPCPECGSQDMVQQIRQSERIRVNEDGDYRSVDPRGPIDVTEVWCVECDEIVWQEE